MKAKNCIFIFFLFMSITLGAEKIVNCVTLNWPPYVSPNLEKNGYSAEITRAAFKRAGYEMKLKFYPWNRAVAMVKSGEADCLLCVYFNKKRTKFFEFSEKIDDVQLVFYKKKNRNISYSELVDLKNYRIGVIAGFAHTEEFDNANYLNKDKAQNIEQSLYKLINDRVDLIIESKRIIQNSISTDFPDYIDQLEAVDPPLKIKPLYNAFSKKIDNAIELREAFDKGLKAIKDDGTYDEILTKYGF